MHVYSIVSEQIKGTVRALNPIRITLSKQQSRSFGTGSSGDCKSLWSTNDIRFSIAVNDITAHSLATTVFAGVTPLAANFASSSVTSFAKCLLRLRDKLFFLAGGGTRRSFLCQPWLRG